jgi:uncharacterized protein (TIGR02611 family)
VNIEPPTETKPPRGPASPPQPTGNAKLLFRQVRRVLVFVLGISVVLVGIVMIVTPGPAVVVIPLGLAILATEFLWAKRLLDSLKRRLSDAHAAATSQVELPRWMRYFLRKKTVGDASAISVETSSREAR